MARRRRGRYTRHVIAPGSTSRFDPLFASVSAASLGAFRIVFGLMMAWHLARYMPYVTETLPASKFFLTFDGFHWVRILPQPWLVGLFVVMFTACALVAVGTLYRPAIVTLWLGWTYTLLLCRGHYNNHSYLFALIAFLMIFVDATRWGSLERALAGHRRPPALIPYWQLFVLRAQIFVVYFYAGIAKLGGDWLHGFPMKIWLLRKEHYPVVGPWLATDTAAYLFSYGGLVFDLAIGFALFSRRTRRWALIPLLFFHLTNAWLWHIGIFPWFMLAATLLFFDPDWPERAWRRISRRGGAPAPVTTAPVGERHRTAVALGLGIYFTWQALFPLRHLLYPGPPEWHGQGNLFSWRMLTVERAHAVRVRVGMKGDVTVGYVKLDEYVNDIQFSKMNRMPKSYLRFAHFLGDEMSRNAGIDDAAIYVDAKRRLNERPYQQLFDPERDMTRVEYRPFANAGYILPFDAGVAAGSEPGWRARARASPHKDPSLW